MNEVVVHGFPSEYELKEPIRFFQKDDKAIWGYPSDGTNVCGQIDLAPIVTVIQARSPTPLTETQQSQALQSYFYSLDLVQLNLAPAATEAVPVEPLNIQFVPAPEVKL